MDSIISESENLDRLRAFMEDMNSTNSSLAKTDILKKYAGDEYVRRVLLYTYDPYRKYYVTVANLEKNPELFEKYAYGSLTDLLDELNARKYTGHAAIGRVNAFVSTHFMYAKQIYAVLDRNLKIRMDVSEINKVFPDLVPTFDVALAKTFERTMMDANARGIRKVDFEKDNWFGSRKLDGARCLCIIDEAGAVAFCSREGHEFYTLEELAKRVRSWNLRSIVFDGEVCLMRPDGSEDFQGIMKQIRKKGHTIPNPKYSLFDCIPLADFRAKYSTTPLSARLENLRAVVSRVGADQAYFNVLPQGRIQSVEHLDKLIEIASKNGWEGLIIRRDAPYEGRRSGDMLKVKEMHDAEYVVTGVNSDEITSTFYRDVLSGADVEAAEGGGWVRPDTGEVVDAARVVSYSDKRMMASNITIVHKGNIVGVGSGLSMAQRRAWHERPEEVIGKTVTIQYFQETEVDGRMSLRFPILKWKYDGERDV